MLLFRSEEDLRKWCAQTDRPTGAVVGLDQVWALSKAWYANRLSLDYQGRSSAEIVAIFRDIGLTGRYWEL